MKCFIGLWIMTKIKIIPYYIYARVCFLAFKRNHYQAQANVYDFHKFTNIHIGKSYFINK